MRYIIGLVVVIILGSCALESENKIIEEKVVEEQGNELDNKNSDFNLSNVKDDLKDGIGLQENKLDTLIFSGSLIGAVYDGEFITREDVTDEVKESLQNQEYVKVLSQENYSLDIKEEAVSGILNLDNDRLVSVKEVDNDIEMPLGYGNLFVSKESIQKEYLLKQEDAPSSTYEILREILDGKGFVNTPVVISECFKANVLGDQANEYIIRATNVNEYRVDDKYFKSLESMKVGQMDDYYGVGVYNIIIVISGDSKYVLSESYTKLDSIYFEDYFEDFYEFQMQNTMFVYEDNVKGYFFTKKGNVEARMFNSVQISIEDSFYDSLFQFGKSSISYIIDLNDDGKVEIFIITLDNQESYKYQMFTEQNEEIVEVYSGFYWTAEDYYVDYFEEFRNQYITW